jgi:NAD(P)-dependent dehydrogenase (short-subunit alcohol dehydrogenase family)
VNLDLTGRVYVVIGRTRGLGFATARELVAEGALVWPRAGTQRQRPRIIPPSTACSRPVM